MLLAIVLLCCAVGGMAERASAMATGVTERSRRFAASLPPLRHNRVRRVYLLRHGMTDWNLRGLVQGAGHDIALNEAGRAQATYAAEELAALPITVVASSHLARASETADAVHALHPTAKRLVDAGFGECNYGELEGRCLHSDDDDARRYKKQFDEVSAKMELDADAGYPDRQRGGGEGKEGAGEASAGNVRFRGLVHMHRGARSDKSVVIGKSLICGCYQIRTYRSRQHGD